MTWNKSLGAVACQSEDEWGCADCRSRREVIALGRSGWGALGWLAGMNGIKYIYSFYLQPFNKSDETRFLLSSESEDFLMNSDQVHCLRHPISGFTLFWPVLEMRLVSEEGVSNKLDAVRTTGHKCRLKSEKKRRNIDLNDTWRRKEGLPGEGNGPLITSFFLFVHRTIVVPFLGMSEGKRRYLVLTCCTYTYPEVFE